MYGLVESPGNDPYVITVAALNTKGTGRRSDDELATYSSKGPTLFDGHIKPDIAAPGNKIVSAEALGASLVTQYPHLHATGSAEDAYASMSGTSMATGVVSGAVALMLEANRGLSPMQVKLALQSSASFMPTAGLLGAGAGSLNAVAAVGAAKHGPSRQTTTIEGELLESSGVVSIQTCGSRDRRSQQARCLLQRDPLGR